jgi:hypothetical protein
VHDFELLRVLVDQTTNATMDEILSGSIFMPTLEDDREEPSDCEQNKRSSHG